MTASTAAGVQGVFVLGTTGEVASVPLADRFRLVQLAIEQVAGRLGHPQLVGLKDSENNAARLEKPRVAAKHGTKSPDEWLALSPTT
jgi:dihydrodipicolinate synthase/N-acetylneuraminate lyase